MSDYSFNNYLSNKESKDQFINVAGYSFCIINKSTHLSYLAKSK